MEVLGAVGEQVASGIITSELKNQTKKEVEEEGKQAKG
jgi:hypothetical protein